ncbi:unnamed protein product [Zymoseptoria tritici ST99CH_3D1]|nr:unnamed protein product [Zymoseptoria tritici ST99CH_3D1]
MFEKDIYQLIRGLRARKGTEREYIAECLRECRKEIRSQDMDAKATALLKLVYLEMFGHDMSWASFNVLEVMSSGKYLQKRVGYLAAVQSFRPDTEVLMLAENLLKKDLNSADKATIGLPLATIPHVVNPSMANSLLTDLLPRLSHSMPAIRKKTIVTLYRLALVYPETLRPAWPKIKERLLDEDEDPSVTAAIVNVVCELGWRRPNDFLPLAPRLFELLKSGNNNWMAIKIIKLFSVLTPLEPRLVKKLLPPLTELIKTTPAMSLLYECINGIIQGGIMEAAEGTTQGDEIARLCVNKLRGMLIMAGDPNLRYVALLAFVKITSSHADLVAQHQDVILECIDDADISIRTRALDLVVGMVNASNLQTVVERLLRQLRTAGKASAADEPEHDRGLHDGIIPMADDDDADAQAAIRAREQKSKQVPPLPDDYRTSVIERILEMCSAETYANMSDFEWYIGVLVELVKQCPSSSSSGKFGSAVKEQSSVADAIGAELLNVAVRVKAVRPEAAAAAQSLLMLDLRAELFPEGSTSSGQGVLTSAAFIAGEYAHLLPNPDAVMTSLLDESNAHLPAETLTSYLEAIPKIFTTLTSSADTSWSVNRKDTTALLIARAIHFFEPLTLHPALEVQERAVEFLDLMRLADEAVSNQTLPSHPSDYAEPPLLLTQAIPSLFSAAATGELNPVAASAVRKVPIPEDLDLDTPINPDLHFILSQADYDTDATAEDEDTNEVYKFYHEKPTRFTSSNTTSSSLRPAADLLDPAARSSSYQSDAGIDDHIDRDALLRKKAERKERNRDDPYYIDPDRSRGGSGTSTPLHRILKEGNEGLDVDDIPVMELKLDDIADSAPRRAGGEEGRKKKRKERKVFEIAADETVGGEDSPVSTRRPDRVAGRSAVGVGKKSLLQLDSSALSTLSLEDDEKPRGGKLDFERRIVEEEAMAKAIREVERARLEMQRREEEVQGTDEVVVKPKAGKKKERRVVVEGGGEADGDADGADDKPKKKKKKKRVQDDGEVAGAVGRDDHEVDGTTEVKEKTKKKKKKKRQVVLEGEE